MQAKNWRQYNTAGAVSDVNPDMGSYVENNSESVPAVSAPVSEE